ADGAADMTDFMLACRARGVDFDLQLVYRHRLMAEGAPGEDVLGLVRSWPSALSHEATIAQRGGREGRRARLRVSYGPVTLRTPAGHEPLAAWVVRAWEVGAPPGAEAVEWVLATSVAVRGDAEARERL